VPALPAGGADGHDDAALRRAIALLGRAGWHLRHFRLVNQAGRPLTISVLIDDAALRAPLRAWQAILTRIGVRLRIDLVDAATFAARKASFRYDLIQADFPAPERPGAAEADYFGCASARVPGGDNLAGLCDAQIDALIGRLAAARDEPARIAAGRALDRALRRLWIVVPGWYAKTVHLAWWNRYKVPARTPRLGYDIDLWAARQAPR
jgi:microcin C transport system substrate-binding protein